MSRTSTARRRDLAALAAGTLAAVLTLTACGSQVAGSGSGDLPLLRIGTGAYAGDVARRRSRRDRSRARTPTRCPARCPPGRRPRRWCASASARVPVSDVVVARDRAGPRRHARPARARLGAGDEGRRAPGPRRRHGVVVRAGIRRSARRTPSTSTRPEGSTASGAPSRRLPARRRRPRLPPPADAAARAAAGPVLAAVGLDAALATVAARRERLRRPHAGRSTRSSTAVPPRVPARSSTSTTLGVARRDGRARHSDPGDAYPIITAAAALDLLRSMPQPEIAIACAIGQKCPGDRPEGRHRCPPRPDHGLRRQSARSSCPRGCSRSRAPTTRHR